MMKLEYRVNELTKYETIHQVLKEELFMSDRLILKLKQTQQIYLNNSPSYIFQKITFNDKITVFLNRAEECVNIIPIEMDLKILYEDEWLLAINKPPFMPVHPSLNHFEDSLSNGVKNYFNSIGLKKKIRPINRLDKNTSGIVLFAKNEYIQECFVKQMKNNLFQKQYLALVDGILPCKKKIINAPIARKENSIIERCIHPLGDVAITEIELLKLFHDYALVQCTLKTGRTHQIRVHMQYIGHPILGDDLYGKSSTYINRQALHAYHVTFLHPITKQKIEITAEIPEDMKKLLL